MNKEWFTIALTMDHASNNSSKSISTSIFPKSETKLTKCDLFYESNMIYETLSTIPGSADSHKESIRSRVHVYRFNSNWEQVNDKNGLLQLYTSWRHNESSLTNTQ